MIEVKRQTLIGMLIDKLYELLRSLRRTDLCHLQCAPRAFNSLFVYLAKWKLLPPPTAPYDGFSLEALLLCLNEVQWEPWLCFASATIHHVCSLPFLLMPIMYAVRSEMTGLSLGDFNRP